MFINISNTISLSV